MRRILLLICFMMIEALLMAQGISVRTFSLSPTDLEAKVNPVYDANGVPTALIRISSNSKSISFSGSIVNEPIFKDGEWMLYMPGETKHLRISAEGAYTLNYEFPFILLPSHSYEMSIRVDTDNNVEMLLMPLMGFGSYQTSYGLMAGAMYRGYGLYLRARSDFNKELAAAYSCDEYGIMADGNMGWFTGAPASSRLSLTAGAMKKLTPLFTAYAGAGFGRRALVWEVYDGQYAIVSTRSFRGIETEAGIILTLGPVALSIGADLCGFKAMEGVVGVGLMF